MKARDLARWVRLRRLARRIRGRLGGWLRWAIQYARRLPGGAERPVPADRGAPTLRVVGPITASPPATDRALLARLESLTPSVPEERLRDLLDRLPADRGLVRPEFPLATYLRQTALWRDSETRYLHRLVADRRPTMAYLQARHGGTDEVAGEPAPVLIEFDPKPGR